MERLTEKIGGHPNIIECWNLFCREVCSNHECSDCPIQRAINKLYEYENAEEEGLIVRVAKGQWIFKNDGAYGKRRAYCSVCGKRSGIGGIESNQRKPYCPNCGANMKGEQHGKIDL